MLIVRTPFRISLRASSRNFSCLADISSPYFFDKVAKARAPLTVGVDGSLSCAAEIPAESTVCILDGEADKMVAAAHRAAEEARAALQSSFDATRSEFDGMRHERDTAPTTYTRT